jgi:hypothetical protein
MQIDSYRCAHNFSMQIRTDFFLFSYSRPSSARNVCIVIRLNFRLEFRLIFPLMLERWRKKTRSTNVRRSDRLAIRGKTKASKGVWKPNTYTPENPPIIRSNIHEAPLRNSSMKCWTIQVHIAFFKTPTHSYSFTQTKNWSRGSNCGRVGGGIY